jgi:beta-lactamase class A
MSLLLTRRAVVAAGFAAALIRSSHTQAQTSEPAQAFAALETQHGGRLGIAALDTGSRRRLAYRADERFPLCSTHKFQTVAAILSRVDHGQMSLDRKLPYSRDDLLAYAPVAKEHVEDGFLTVEAACAAAIQWSDNTADNLLLGLLGGPAGWTRYARSLGDQVSRLDRLEPALNSGIPDDPRDTSSPAAMVGALDTVLLGTALSAASRARLETWMLAGKVSDTLLRAAVPAGWRVGDKSGSGERGSRNDIGILRPPRTNPFTDAPILVAVYYTGSSEPLASRESVVAEAGRIIVGALAARA